VRILLPMLAHAHEIEQSLNMVKQAKQQLDEKRIAYDKTVEVGGMIEVRPRRWRCRFHAAARFPLHRHQRPHSYTLAIDRTDDAVAHLYDPLHPAVLHLIAHTIQAPTAAARRSRCAARWRRARLTRLLLGFGLRNFSMHAQQLLAIKERVLRTNLAEAQPLAQRVLRQSDPAKTRELL